MPALAYLNLSTQSDCDPARRPPAAPVHEVDQDTIPGT
jgi:hypothetical protein